MLNVALLGASGGIGAAIVEQLQARADIGTIHATRFKSLPDTDALQAQSPHQPNTIWSTVDATDESSIQQWISGVGQIDWLINCVGFLHDEQTKPEKTIRQFSPEDFQKCMNLNCLVNLLLAKYALGALKQSEQGVFASITARVGSIEDNRLGGWYSYRASKAAANMVLKSVSIEWQRTAPTRLCQNHFRHE